VTLDRRAMSTRLTLLLAPLAQPLTPPLVCDAVAQPHYHGEMVPDADRKICEFISKGSMAPW
jgi:hypothetical protein